MSNDDLDAVTGGVLRVHRGTRTHHRRALAAVAVVALGVGMAACGGDDDDASDTVPGTDPVETSLPATLPPATTRPTTTVAQTTTEPTSPTTTAAEGTTTPAEGTADAATPGTEEAATEDTADAGEEEPAGTDATDAAPVPPGTASPSGPTTTGPECEYTANDEFPIERCNRGDPVAVIQSVLQVLGYEIGTVDCLFGDQTLYAVRAFQGDRGLTVDGIVGPDTWAELDIPSAWGEDADGSGILEPNELDLPEPC